MFSGIFPDPHVSSPRRREYGIAAYEFFSVSELSSACGQRWFSWASVYINIHVCICIYIYIDMMYIYIYIYIYVYAGVVHYFALPLSLFLDAQSSSYRIV